jgi:hypothetical protein
MKIWSPTTSVPSSASREAKTASGTQMRFVSGVAPTALDVSTW